MRKIWRSLRITAGQSLVEYALILALAVIVLVAALTVLGGKTSNAIDEVTNAMP